MHKGEDGGPKLLERTKAPNKSKKPNDDYMFNSDDPRFRNPGFKDGGGVVSLGLILSPVGGKHLFEKKAGITLALLLPFSAN